MPEKVRAAEKSWPIPSPFRTLGHLSAKRGGYGDKVEVLRSVVDRHLLPAAKVAGGGEALVAELLESEIAVHENT